jgi:AraC-like DNA-binding protein
MLSRRAHRRWTGLRIRHGQEAGRYPDARRPETATLSLSRLSYDASGPRTRVLDSRMSPATAQTGLMPEDERGSGGFAAWRSSVVNAEAYESSVAGVQIHSARGGPGGGANSVLAVREERFTSTSCRIGFPTLSWATVPDDHLIVAAITGGGAGSRWCGIDLAPGAVLLYAPGVEHVASNLPGLSFTFASTTLEQIGVMAEGLGLGLDLPERGRVVALESMPDREAVRGAFCALRDAAVGGSMPGWLADEALRSLVAPVSAHATATRVGHPQRVRSRHAVNLCIDYAEAIRRVPSIAELCRVTRLSERSLRRSFQSEVGRSPSQFLRAWAMDEANRRLRSADAEVETVTDVALGLGFTHLGRFAESYRRQFGESPSVTLRSRGLTPAPRLAGIG